MEGAFLHRASPVGNGKKYGNLNKILKIIYFKTNNNLCNLSVNCYETKVQKAETVIGRKDLV
jgi:hypothetical protein